ncbi:X-ray repair cross-complementing protein 5 [Epargyreus clarus]|uniref:X-ray repair cross-complementing protein 5 n=1 Tax=Epargyreus clarus TaxID=520877 RepID=UPI003C2E3CD6
MGSKKIDRATLIILDIGRNVSTPEEKNEKSFFENARECTGRIIERKILSQDKNYLGIILLGTKKTKNNMALQCSGTFKHIDLFAELQNPTWQLIRDLPEKATNSEGDWFDSLIVAADHLKNGVEGVKFTNKQIILMTNFKSSSDFDSNSVETVINGFKEEKFEVDIFGPHIYENSYKSPDLDLAQKLVHATGGVSVTFDYCMKFLLFHQKKAVNCIPWNVDLSFTPDVKIPVSCFVKLKDEPVVKKWMKAVKDPVTKSASSTEGIVHHKTHVNLENQAVVESSDLIEGYHYGQQIIPVSDYKKRMLYESGEKSLKVYGFTNADNITWHHLNGDNLLYVFGRKGDKKAQQAIRCLVECLQEQNLVGVVRRVFNKGNAPKMFALMPVIDSNNFVCLSMVGMCYKEEIKNMAFPPTNLKKYACTEEQVDAFKDLIKAMDLTKAYDDIDVDDAEAFPIAETASPTAQYILDCIAFRAMNPDKPLPQPRDDIMKLFEKPPLVEKRSKEPIEKLKNMFVLKKVEVKTRSKNNESALDQDQGIKPSDSTANDNDVEMHDVPKVDLSYLLKTKEVSNIGTTDPISDYQTLKNNGKSLGDLSPQMTEAIECLIHTNIDGTYSKALKCLEFFRTECVNSDPSYYNNWLKGFKMELLDNKKNNVIELIDSKKLGFILKNENDSSNFENGDQGDSQLYENDTQPNLTNLTISSQMKKFLEDM